MLTREQMVTDRVRAAGANQLETSAALDTAARAVRVVSR